MKIVQTKYYVYSTVYGLYNTSQKYFEKSTLEKISSKKHKMRIETLQGYCVVFNYGKSVDNVISSITILASQ